MTNLKQHKTNMRFIRRNAFTLVEVMVGIILTTIVFTAAYMIWSRVQQRIARSYTKQRLQNELRTVANYMQNDFKSIKFHDKDDKFDEDSDKAVDITGDDKNFTMTFQKFKEVKDEDSDKLAQDVVEDVKYSLNSNLLMRTSGRSSKLLSSHCEEIHVTPAAGDNSDDDDYQNASEEVRTAKEAQLDIEITGKMIVPGSGEEMYHVEKTSVVMRNEYYKKINKNYKSNFDLAKLDADDVVGEGAAGALSGEEQDLSQLDSDVLMNLRTSEEEVLKSLNDSLDDIDQSISDTAPEDVPWYKKLWANVKDVFGDDTDAYTLFKDSREKLEKAQSVSEVESAIKTIKKRIEDDEKKFYGKSYTVKSYNSMSEEEKTTFKRAYDMAIQQRTIDDAYDKLEDKSGGKPTSNIDLQRQIIKEYNPNDTSPGAVTKEQYEEAKKLTAVYDKIDLSWMDESESEVGIYKANKQLLDQANTKLEILRSKEKTEQNIGEINGELNKRS